MRRESDGPTPDQAGQPISEERQADLEHSRHLQRERQARVGKALVGLFVLGILIAFIVANGHSVKVNFVFVTRKPPLIWVMFACAVLGGILGYLVGRPGKQVRFHRQKKEDERRR
jgi:uncharacterized integral membrane protein